MAFQDLSHLLPNQMQQATAASVGNFIRQFWARVPGTAIIF